MNRVVIIGAGVGGLSTAAFLARAGLDVTVLEAHVYPGGCAGTFYHQGYRFDAGATLAAGFTPGGPMDRVAQAAGIDAWPVGPEDDLPVMRVHLPDGAHVDRWADERRRAVRLEHFGCEGEPFWRWQERTADALWALALRSPAWPPQSVRDVAQLAQTGIDALLEDSAVRLDPTLLVDALRPLSVRLAGLPDRLRLFVDAQLLISAQTTSARANALYAAAALDLPRRGVVHLAGGIGTIAETLAHAVVRLGGRIVYRQEAARIVIERGRPVAVETARGDSFPADVVIANLTPWGIARLLSDSAPRRLASLAGRPERGWGAFTLHVGADANAIPVDSPLHHQAILREPLGEGNTAFVSISPAWDTTRAPGGQRALTITTHTDLHAWWALFETDRSAYEARKAEFSERLLDAASVALPGLRDAARLVLPGTPVTTQRYTRRASGWVGGFPQTGLLSAWGPRVSPGVWMVGDSIFPGQSVPAVALRRAARGRRRARSTGRRSACPSQRAAATCHRPAPSVDAGRGRARGGELAPYFISGPLTGPAFCVPNE